MVWRSLISSRLLGCVQEVLLGSLAKFLAETERLFASAQYQTRDERLS